ncbi:hypothetical protein [Stutzerimonas nitrititolerans]|uniref:hypothetical protein n=1 Tax=Stutzerimonas nitrititolerans TaxID=2482751 RepID=UPI0028A5FCE4|nr:hypothetical protein [Stutzerimonas nitrititolerans]
MSDEGKDQRIEFKHGVRQVIWRRAGGLCSIKGCLKSVNGSDGNLDIDGVPHRASSIGEAAHIYSARKNWARGHGDQSPEFIGSAANGILTCRNCHGNVDSVASKYSAETLFEMKHVRETAQDLNRHHPAVSFYVSRVGTEHLDHLVWTAADRSDEQSIADKFIIYAESAVQVLRALKSSIGPSMPSPEGLERNAIVGAISRATEPQSFVFDRTALGPIQEVRCADLRQAQSDQVARTIELAESWTCGNDKVLFNDKVRCELFTRDPVTGIAGEPVLFDVWAIVAKSNDQEHGFECQLKITQFENYSVGFLWNMEAVLNEKGHSLLSTLRLARFACPDSTDDHYEFRAFAGYVRLLKEIATGRIPRARLSRHNTRSRYEAKIHQSENQLHPLEFFIDVLDSPERIREVISFNEKALLGYSLSVELGTTIIYRRPTTMVLSGPDFQNARLLGFFDPYLTEQMIRESINEARENAVFDRRGRFVSRPLVEMQVSGHPCVIRAYHTVFNTSFILEAAKLS